MRVDMSKLEHRPIRVKKQSSHDILSSINRMLKLVGDKTLSEILAGLTVLELWVALIGLVLWLSVGENHPEIQWQSKGIFLLGLLCGFVTGAIAAIVWKNEKQASEKESARWSEW
jgi:hypothetical protein